MPDRRLHRIPLPGGARAGDYSLTLRDCAAWGPFSIHVLRRAVHRGELPAENRPGPHGKASWVTTHDGLLTFLKRRHWQMLTLTGVDRVALLEVIAARQRAEQRRADPMDTPDPMDTSILTQP